MYNYKKEVKIKSNVLDRLENLSLEMIDKVLSFMDKPQLVALLLTNRRWYQIVQATDSNQNAVLASIKKQLTNYEKTPLSLRLYHRFALKALGISTCIQKHFPEALESSVAFVAKMVSKYPFTHLGVLNKEIKNNMLVIRSVIKADSRFVLWVDAEVLRYKLNELVSGPTSFSEQSFEALDLEALDSHPSYNAAEIQH